MPEAVEILKRDTRHFAKRQITWFKREEDVIWLNKQDYAYDEDKNPRYYAGNIKRKGYYKMNLSEMYQEMGIDQNVYAYGQKITEDLKERFAEIDETAEYNQLKVLHAMQKNRVSDIHFAATSGYGYNDLGRDTLESVYADTFHAEAGLVRPQITCGTHALAIALAANLRREMSF